MKKRIACLILTLVMLIGLIPTVAVRASAAVNISVSEAGIKVIKEYMGFQKNAYETYQGSGDYRIGYGTPSVKDATITEANADKYLREKLDEIEGILSRDGVITKSLVQRRMDALVWYSYVEGTGWASGSDLLDAVNSNIADSTLVNAMCTWGYSTGFPNDAGNRAVVTRRLAMANMYVNGSYNATNAGSMGFTVFDAEEGAAFPSGARTMVQAFNGSSINTITVPEPSLANAAFLGWYTGDAMVTGVGAATNGAVLTAHWQRDAAVGANYTLAADTIYQASLEWNRDGQNVVVYRSPYDLTKIDVVNRDATVTVVAEQVVNGEKWIQISTGGWVRLGAVSKVPASITNLTVTITDDYVNIRQEPNANSARVATAKRGEQRTITMLSDTDNGKWGYCSQGWLFLAYTDYSDKSGSTTPNLGSGIPGTVTGSANVNVRAAAGVGNALVTRLPEGTAITVYEQTTADGAAWGHIDQGWISMGYVKLSQTTATGANVASGSSAVVSSSVSLNVRSGPGTGYSKIGTLAPGTSVVILRKQTVSGVAWGLIDQGWINLNYVSAVSSASPTGTGSTYGVGGTVVNCSTGVNIRSAAGTTNALIGVAPLGSRVTVTDITQVNGFSWGQIDRGWVCMEYVQLDSEFKRPEPVSPSVEDDAGNVVESFQGYPAKVTKNSGAQLRETASADAKSLLTLKADASVNVLAWSQSGENLYGKVTVGDKTGWVNLSDVTLDAFNAKVTASKADVYEEASTRSQFYTSLVQGTYITIPQGNANWKLSDGVLWGRIEITVKKTVNDQQTETTHTGWLKLSDVTMFKGNITPTGITTLSGVGYLTGTVNGSVPLGQDSNGNVVFQMKTDEKGDAIKDEYGNAVQEQVPTGYTLTNGTRVNILARNYIESTGKTYGKVTVGSVTGWIPMDVVTLDAVPMKANADVKAYASLDVVVGPSTGTIAAGNRFTVTQRSLFPDGNEINHGVIDVGYGYLNDDIYNTCYVVLDNGKLVPTGEAVTVDPSNPVIASTVVVTGTVGAKGLTIYEEAIVGSRELLKLSGGTQISILNWKNVSGITWGKVQINKIVGWVMIDNSIDFSTLEGVVAVEELKVYNTADKASTVQVLRVNNQPIQINSIQYDGSVLWGNITVANYSGWIDLADVTLNTPGWNKDNQDPSNLPVIAKGKINSVNATVNITDGGVTTLPKSTEVSLIGLEMDSTNGAKWLVDLGDKDGWIDMDCVTMYSAIATITESKVPIYNDLRLNQEEILYTLYRGEQATVLSFKDYAVPKNYQDLYGTTALYGEVAYGDTTGWILICDASSKMYVSLTPGSTGTTLGSTGTAAPTEPTTSAADPIPAYIVCATTVNVRSGAGVENTLVTTLPNGTNVKIYEQTTVLGKGWARIDQGWVCMDYVRMGTLATVPNGGTNGNSGSVSIMTTVPSGAIAVGYANEDIKIRSGSGLGYPEVGSVKKNNSVVIYENKLDGGMSWGRTDSGWVCTSYLTITGIGAAGSGNTGTIARCGFTANVRNSANSGGALMAKVMISSRVVVHETTVVGAETWGRTDLGWISMQYIVMDNEAAPVPSGSTDSTGATQATVPTETGDLFVG